MANSLDLTKLTTDEGLYLRAKATYAIGQPIIDDVEFDILEEHLRQQDSFVVDIVGAIKIKGNKVSISKGKKLFIAHTTPMGSLAKIQFKPGYVPHPEFSHWLTSNVLSNTDPVLEFGPKLDGNAINITYDNGQLKSVTSRGDGIEGQDYTKCYPSNIPKYIKGFTGEIRGEAVMDVYVFDNTYGPDSNAVKKYANARNIVASGLTKGDPSMIADIDFIAFQIVDFTGDTNTQLIKWGFDTLNFLKTYASSQMNLFVFEKMYAEFKYYRENCKYQLDGIVCKIEEEYRDAIGGNSHHPYWALAIKFETKEVYTTIVSIEWSLGKRGQLAPVAILAPVNLLGSVVQRASVYNADWMLKNKCYPGATVSLIKSGDIIPKIVAITIESTEVFELPTVWNGNSVSFDGVQLMVDDFEQTDAFKSLQLHNSIVALGIEGIGPATASKLQDAGQTLISLLSTNPDGLRMELLKSDVFKDGRDLEILVENVFALTKTELWKVIYAMNYRNCGKTISKQLGNWMAKIPFDFKGLEKAVVEAFIMDIDKQDEVKHLVGILLANNVNIIKPEAPKAGIITYCMTGSPSSGHATKKDYSRDVESSGKCIESSLTKETHYLVAESLAGMTTKMQKAEKNGTKIICYSDFLDLIKSL
jgi:DNA ligase (NAD+)